MYILRAFPFSFAILWRYALVFPIVFVVLAIYGGIAVLLALLLGLASPALAALVAMSFGLAASVIPAMVGTRLGLQARGVRPRNNYIGLMGPAIGYGLFEGFCLLIVFAVSLGVLLFSVSVSFPDMLKLAAQGNDVLFARLLEANAPATLAVIGVASLWMISIRAALLVPFAGASIDKDPNGKPHTPFYGFGSGFWSILILVILSYAGMALIGPVVGLIAGWAGYGDVLTAAAAQVTDAATDREVAAIGVEFFIAFGVFSLISLWIYSLQCAGAALVFLRHKQAYDMEFETYQDGQQKDLDPIMPKTDMRALLQSRMPHKKY